MGQKLETKRSYNMKQNPTESRNRSNKEFNVTRTWLKVVRSSLNHKQLKHVHVRLCVGGAHTAAGRLQHVQNRVVSVLHDSYVRIFRLEADPEPSAAPP